MEKDYLLRKIKLHFDELGLHMDYLKDQNVETLGVVENFSASLARIKKKCTRLPPWAVRTFEQTLENYALRATLMAGNMLLLQERKEIIETMDEEVGKIENKQKEYHNNKEKIISTLNVLKASGLPSDVFESELKDLALSEKKMEKKKFASFTHVEKEIASLLTKSDNLATKIEKEKHKSLTEEQVKDIPEVRQYLDMVTQLEDYGVTAGAEKECISAHVKGLLDSDYHAWSQLFHELSKDTENLKNRIVLAETLQNSFKILEHAGMDDSLKEARSLYEGGDLMKAERSVKILEEKYEKMKKETKGRKKIAQGILLQCEKIISDLPSEVSEDLKGKYETFQTALKDDIIPDGIVDEMQAFKTEVEHVVSAWIEREKREKELEKMVSELKGKIKNLEKTIKKHTSTFENFGCKKENIENFKKEINAIKKEITAIFAGDTSKEVSEDIFRSVSNRLSHIDVRIENVKARIVSYTDVYGQFVKYKESYIRISPNIKAESREKLKKNLGETEEFLKEHLFDFDFPTGDLYKEMEEMESLIREKEADLKRLSRTIEKMKNELMIIKGDIALMGYPQEAEHYEKEIQQMFGKIVFPVGDEYLEELEKEKEALAESLKEHLYTRIENEIEMLENIKRKGDIKRYEFFIGEIIGMTGKYGFSGLKKRVEVLKGQIIERECPYLDCGEYIEGDIQFCPFCGRKLVFCPGCGKYHKAETKFCPITGRLLKVEEYIQETLDETGSIGFKDLVEINLEEGEARQEIQAFYDKYSLRSEEVFGDPLIMEDFCIVIHRMSCEEKIRELLPVHGTLTADDLDNCSPNDILRFYEKYKDNAQEELGYNIEVVGDMIVKK